jgi:hypothetical protein
MIGLQAGTGLRITTNLFETETAGKAAAKAVRGIYQKGGIPLSDSNFNY